MNKKNGVKEESVSVLKERLAAYETRLLEMEQANEELKDFVENAAQPLHWVNNQGIITWANQAELDALGYDKSEYIGRPISEFHADPDTIADILSRLKNNETLLNYRAQLLCKDGSVKHVLISSNVFRKNGEFIHTRCFTRDITAMVLEEQRKNDFVSMVSHELKTPLTTILSYIQVMIKRVEKLDDSFFSQALSRTEKQARSMTRLINDFLNMSRLEEAKVQLNLEIFELHFLIQEVIQEIQLNHHQQDIKFINAGLVRIKADRAKLGQVLINLLSNAIKYSPDSSTITVGYQRQDASVKIYVHDEGFGISKANQEHLFKRFYRVENEQTKHTTGFGIGLYLVAEILRYHQSKIEVESELGEGSTFYFSLPMED